MRRVRLRFENIQRVMGSDRLAVILLTDESRQRVLSVVCDELMSRQILLRLQSADVCRNRLPEVLSRMLPEGKYELMVYGVHDGQYQVVLYDAEFNHYERLRMSDAVLLNIIANCPLYIEEKLMQNQSAPFNEHATGASIPINTMDRQRLDSALKKAVDEENYELASMLRDEIKRRTE